MKYRNQAWPIRAEASSNTPFQNNPEGAEASYRINIVFSLILVVVHDFLCIFPKKNVLAIIIAGVRDL